VRILIADDYEIIRAGVRALLRWRTDVHIVEASNGQEPVDQARRTNPDVLILDLAMPVMTGLEAARHSKEEMPQVPILIMSTHDDGHAMTRELAKIGVQGFVSKTRAAQKLPDAIETVLAGETYFGGMST
jgi:DNA-binding NarL/FixJ family response regulator